MVLIRNFYQQSIINNERGLQIMTIISFNKFYEAPSKLNRVSVARK